MLSWALFKVGSLQKAIQIQALQCHNDEQQIHLHKERRICYIWVQPKQKRKTVQALLAQRWTQLVGGGMLGGGFRLVRVWKDSPKLAVVFLPAEGRPGPTPPPSSSCLPCFSSTCGGRESTFTLGEVRDSVAWRRTGEVHGYSSGSWISFPSRSSRFFFSFRKSQNMENVCYWK